MKPEGQKDSVYALALDQDGKLLASGSPSALVCINDCRSGSKVMKLRGHTDNIRCVTPVHLVSGAVIIRWRTEGPDRE